MPKVSRDTAENHDDMGPMGVDHWSDLKGYRAEFVTIRQDADLTPLFVGLPNDECQCSHLGYVLEGRIWFRIGEETESCVAGDAFYFTPGHTAGAVGGSEFVIFTPSDQAAELSAHMMKRAQELQSASGR